MLTYKNFCWLRSYLVKDPYLRSESDPTCRTENTNWGSNIGTIQQMLCSSTLRGDILPLSPSSPEQQNFNSSHYSLPPAGGAVGIGKAGAVQVCRQTSGHLQWRKQTQALHCHCSHRVPITHLPGKKNRCSLRSGQRNKDQRVNPPVSSHSVWSFSSFLEACLTLKWSR